jgi:hypothetical protein
MGSKGSKKRKRQQHLPKVGTPAEVQWAEHQKRQEVMNDVGIHKPTSGAGRVLMMIGGAIAIGLVVAGILVLALR